MAIFCRVTFLGRDNQADFVGKAQFQLGYLYGFSTSGVVTTHLSNLANH
jgi:hypothetical protein